MTAEDPEPDNIPCPICTSLTLPDSPHRDEDILDHLYHDHTLTQKEISDVLECSRTTVRTWMDNYEIERRPSGFRKKTVVETDDVPCPICESSSLPDNPHRSERILTHLYDDHFLNKEEVAEQLDCSLATVSKWFNEFDIETRPTGTRYEMPEDELYHLYVEKGLSPNEVAEHFGCTHTAVRNRLEKYGIEIRDGMGASEIEIEVDTTPCPICDSPSLPDNPYRSRDILIHLFNEHDLTQTEIADYLDCSVTTLKTWKNKFDIETSQFEYKIPEDELRTLYLEENLSISEIANRYDCSYTAVHHRMDLYGIDQRGPGEVLADPLTKEYRDEEKLRELYREDGLSKLEIADRCGVAESTVQYWMNKFGIDARSYQDAQGSRHTGEPYRNEGLLNDLYWKEGLSQREIAEELECGFTTVQKWMNHFDIDLRYAGAHGNTYETKRGEYVRSTHERQIANWLYDRNIDYDYEPDVEKSLIPDFLIDGVFVEYWGMLNRDDYVERMEEKKQVYSQMDTEVIHLYPNDLNSLSNKLGRFTNSN